MSNQFQYYRLNNRLAQYRQESDGVEQEFWEERWSKHNVVEVHKSYQSGKLDDFEEIFVRYLPNNLPILEAGCGMGQLVVGLTARGYQVEGVDYAEQTIGLLNQVAPALSFRKGDVYHLDVPAGSYGGYISIGIFEHNPMGPLEGLQEVYRVLDREGIAFISIPLLNRKRQTWLPSAHPTDHLQIDGLAFYQYYFSENEFRSFLTQAGLMVVEVYPYALYSGLTRDFTLGRWLHKKGFFAWPIHKRVIWWCRNAPFSVRHSWSHMMMFVCKKV